MLGTQDVPWKKPWKLIKVINHAVSQPQLQHTSSAQSIAASEDYYSLSSSSEYSDEQQRSQSLLPIHRYQTPPSRYRTPMASRERIPGYAQESTIEQRQSPMRGAGAKRRSMSSERVPTFSQPLQSGQRHSPVRRAPIPSTVYESSPKSEHHIDPRYSQSSAAQEINREYSPPTPGVDDTPYIQLALDQLTRDEEVRGSRVYAGQRPRSFSRPIRSPTRYSEVPETFKEAEAPTPIPPRHPRHSISPRHSAPQSPGQNQRTHDLTQSDLEVDSRLTSPQDLEQDLRGLNALYLPIQRLILSNNH